MENGRPYFLLVTGSRSLHRPDERKRLAPLAATANVVSLFPGSTASKLAKKLWDAANLPSPPEAWARKIIRQRLEELLPEHDGTCVVTGGATGPDTWAVQIAKEMGLGWMEYKLDGYLWINGQRTVPWLGGEDNREDSEKTLPLWRNQHMVDDLADKSERMGIEVGVLALRDPESKTHGTDHTAKLARRRKIPVESRTYGED